MSKRWLAAAFAFSLLGGPLAFAEDAPKSDVDQHQQDRAEWHQKMCTEHYARKASRLAYLEAKLALTEPQRAEFNKWRQIKLDAAGERRTACLQHQHKEGATLTALDREARREKFLSARLAQLQASKPALQALYDSLSPEQKTVFDQAEAGHHHRGHRYGWQHEGEGREGSHHRGEGWHHQDQE
jgi:LTXXQ motif family protein